MVRLTLWADRRFTSDRLVLVVLVQVRSNRLWFMGLWFEFILTFRNKAGLGKWSNYAYFTPEVVSIIKLRFYILQYFLIFPIFQ